MREDCEDTGTGYAAVGVFTDCLSRKQPYCFFPHYAYI